MPAPQLVSRGSQPDEGDGDLGLQGLHLEQSPTLPRHSSSSSRPLESPPDRKESLQVLMSSFGSSKPVDMSSRSIGSSSCSSTREDVSPFSLPVSPPSNGSALPKAGETDDTIGSKSKTSKTKRRFSKLRIELASEPALAEGVQLETSARPLPSPRTPSSKSFRRRSSHKKEETSKSGSGSGNDRTDAPSSALALSGGTSSTGLLMASPMATSFVASSSSNDSPYTPVIVPDRVTSLSKDKVKRKSKGNFGDEIAGRALSRDGPKNSTSASAKSTAAASTVSSLSEAVQAGMQRWILSVGCVNFDLEKGPDLEFLYPSLGISREERDNIAFSSFPDTSIFDDGQAIFSWRVREVPLDSSISEAPVVAASSKKQRTPSQSPSLDSPSSSARFPTLPNMARKGSSNSNTSQAHKIWNFDKGRKNPSRSLSSGSVEPDSSVIIHSDDSGRDDSPCAPAEKRGNGVPYENMNSIGTLPSVTAEEIDENKDIYTSKEDGMSTTKIIVTSNRTKKSMSSNFIHGYCYFRQKKDASIRRGYFQKSVVILSHLPYVSLFSEIVKKLGPLFFEKGMTSLEAFSRDVHNWPPPEPGARLHLAMLGSVLSVDLPLQSQFQTSLAAEARIVQNLNAPGKARSGLHVKPDSLSRRGSEEEPILASIPSTPLFDLFRESLDDLWLLWECLLLADPILVVGPDPRICSEAVWHLLDLIRPIPFAGDFRPFFTIHDYDFKTLVTKNKPNAGVILGVTNPFMLQACKHWPHVFKVGNGLVRTKSLAAAAAAAAAKTANRRSVSGPGAVRSASMSGGGGGGGGIAGGNSAGGGGPEHMPGLLTKRKRRISKDRPLLRKLHEMAESGADDEAANAMLRRYFSDLTGE